MILKKLYIDQHIADHPTTQSIKARLKVPTEIVECPQEVYDAISSAADPVRKGKEVLYLTNNRGAFFKRCPGTSHYTCCDYHILHIGTFCHMDCAYCVLQTYFHPPILQFFVNHDDLMTELNTVLSQEKIMRIGTGEFTDSLIWELWTDLSGPLIQRFASQNHAVLELKTKTTAIQKLQLLAHNRKTIAAWSLNTDQIINTQERATASLTGRLKAAVKCESWGYPLAFHFDPLVIYDGCEKDYSQVIDDLFSNVSADNIAWISLGTLRFPPALKARIENRFPESKIIYEEFITGLDGKMRYFKPLRIKLYQKIITDIRELAPDVLIYLCMEDDEVWEESLGFKPAQRGGLAHMLDMSAARHCHLELTE